MKRHYKRNFCEAQWAHLSAAQRQKCADELGISLSTMYLRIKDPGKLTVTQAESFVGYINRVLKPEPKWRVRTLVKEMLTVRQEIVAP
jgi:hypothetical protein